MNSSSAVVTRSRSQIQPLDVAQTRHAMQMHQEQLAQIVDESDWQSFTRQDRQTGERTHHRFLKRSGWRKIAFWYSLDLEVRTEQIERNDRGDPIRAHVVARARHPNGRYADGDGGASLSERRFSKAEHDLAGTATTRAMNRAISNLVGMGDLSAEELDGAGDEGIATLDNAGEEKVAMDLERRWPELDAVDFLAKLERRFGGAIPEPAGAALRAWAWFAGLPPRQDREGPQAAPQVPRGASTQDQTDEEIAP